jgi:hypothetical protein
MDANSETKLPKAKADAEQLRKELANVIDRWAKESDLTMIELLGVLRMTEENFLQSWRES